MGCWVVFRAFQALCLTAVPRQAARTSRIGSAEPKGEGKGAGGGEGKAGGEEGGRGRGGSCRQALSCPKNRKVFKCPVQSPSEAYCTARSFPSSQAGTERNITVELLGGKQSGDGAENRDTAPAVAAEEAAQGRFTFWMSVGAGFGILDPWFYGSQDSV